jgi:hypothetical protein
MIDQFLNFKGLAIVEFTEFGRGIVGETFGDVGLGIKAINERKRRHGTIEGTVWESDGEWKGIGNVRSLENVKKNVLEVKRIGE